MTRRYGFLLALLLTLVPANAAAQDTGSGGITLKPSRVEAEIDRGDRIPTVMVSNSSAQAVNVEVQPLPAVQALDGLPDYELTRERIREGNEMLAVTPKKFRLDPNSERAVNARVLSCPQVGLGTYGVIVFVVTPIIETNEEAKGTVLPQLRLAAPLLLTYPPKNCTDAKLVGVRGEQGPDDTLSFFGRVRNLGDRHLAPQVNLRILKGEEEVFAGQFTPENVIPRSDRELFLSIKKKLPAGSYRAVAITNIGGRESTVTWKFKLVGPNQLPTAALKLDKLSTPDAEPGKPFRTVATVSNTGTAPASGVLEVALYRTGAGTPLLSKRVDVRDLKPDESREIPVPFDALPVGDYQLRAKLLTDGRPVGEIPVPFRVQEGEPLSTQILNWLATHILVTLGIFVLLLILVVFLLRRPRKPKASGKVAIQRRSSRALTDIPPASARASALPPSTPGQPNVGASAGGAESMEACMQRMEQRFAESERRVQEAEARADAAEQQLPESSPNPHSPPDSPYPQGEQPHDR